jgi:hypothetical protein
MVGIRKMERFVSEIDEFVGALREIENMGDRNGRVASVCLALVDDLCKSPEGRNKIANLVARENLSLDPDSFSINATAAWR